MIVGLGIDIAPVARPELPLRDPGDAFLDAVSTSAATACCESKPHRARHFAAHFDLPIHLSLTHTDDFDAAIVVMEGASPMEVQE